MAAISNSSLPNFTMSMIELGGQNRTHAGVVRVITDNEEQRKKLCDIIEANLILTYPIDKHQEKLCDCNLVSDHLKNKIDVQVTNRYHCLERIPAVLIFDTLFKWRKTGQVTFDINYLLSDKTPFYQFREWYSFSPESILEERRIIVEEKERLLREAEEDLKQAIANLREAEQQVGIERTAITSTSKSTITSSSTYHD